MDKLPTVRTLTKSLPVPLNPEEKMELGAGLVAVMSEISEEEARQENQKAAMKGALASLEGRQRDLAGRLRSGVKYVEVTVRIERIPEDADKVVEVREDTGATIAGPRVPTAEERQMMFPPAAKS